MRNIINPEADEPRNVRILPYYIEDSVYAAGEDVVLQSVSQLQDTIEYYEDMGYRVTVEKMKLRVTSTSYHLEFE